MSNHTVPADKLLDIAENDVQVLIDKGKTYGNSWKRRGGTGAFMMLARKWDRIENQAKAQDYDVFSAALHDPDGMLDDIGDLRRYLLLVEEEVRAQLNLRADGKTAKTCGIE